MFYILQADRRSLIDLWDDIVNDENIDPYSELNINSIENYNRFLIPDLDIPLVYVDDELGVCGCALLTPLETNGQYPDLIGHNAQWILHAVNINLKNTSDITLHPTKIEEIKLRFYTQLRASVCKLLEFDNSNGLLVLSQDIAFQNEFQHYTRFVITHETNELDKKGNVIGVIPDVRLYLNEQHVPRSAKDSAMNNVVFLKTAFS